MAGSESSTESNASDASSCRGKRIQPSLRDLGAAPVATAIGTDADSLRCGVQLTKFLLGIARK